MKLLRYGNVGQEKPGLLDSDGNIRDLSGTIPDLAGEALSPASLRKLAALDASKLPVVSGNPRLGPPIAGTTKFIGIGLNYGDHALETAMALPTEPLMFLKANSAICGPRDPLPKPRESTKLDYEVELGIVIGTRAKYVSEADALNYVAGYALINDVSERAFQLERQGQFTKGKSCDNFGPVGPWLVTADEIADPQVLKIWLDVNGQRRQDGSTATMVHKIPFLIAYLSRLMTLHPGDIISTGTPPGVGMGMKPPQFLNVGDVITLGIEGLGEQRQEVVAD